MHNVEGGSTKGHYPLMVQARGTPVDVESEALFS